MPLSIYIYIYNNKSGKTVCIDKSHDEFTRICET